MTFHVKENIVVYGDMACYPFFLLYLLCLSLSETKTFVDYLTILFLVIAAAIDGLFIYCFFDPPLRKQIFSNDIRLYYKYIHIVDMLAIPAYLFFLVIYFPISKDYFIPYLVIFLPLLADCTFTYLYLNDMFDAPESS